MKKLGFTLVELLAVIVIIAIISLVTVPTVSNSLQKYKTKVCETQINQIVSAAKSWGADHIYLLPSEICTEGNDDKCKIEVTLSELTKQGYIEDVKNPMTKEKFDSDNVKIEIKKENKKFVYTLDEQTSNVCKN